MTPEQISAIGTIAFILDKLGTWPIGMILVLVIIGPWVGMFIVARGQEKRHQGVVEMYESNVKLVEAYEKHVEALEGIVGDMREMIILNTQAWQSVKDRADNNLFCPMVQKRTKPEGPTS